MNLTSAAFNSGETIPDKYSCDGENISPPLSWDSVPEGTGALALIVDDPDAPAGTFTHWLLYNLEPERLTLPEGASPEGDADELGLQGRNDFGNNRYEGPCPPAGPAHTYYFRLYALDEPLGLSAGATRQQLLDAMERKEILEQAEMQGNFARRRPG